MAGAPEALMASDRRLYLLVGDCPDDDRCSPDFTERHTGHRLSHLLASAATWCRSRLDVRQSRRGVCDFEGSR
jgi:hypothetical protein